MIDQTYFTLSEMATMLGYKGSNGLTQMIKRYPVPPIAKIGNLSAYSQEQYEWISPRFGPTALHRFRHRWATP